MLQTSAVSAVSDNGGHIRKLAYSRPARAAFNENGSLRNKAPVTMVHIGAKNVSTVASDNDRYRRDE